MNDVKNISDMDDEQLIKMMVDNQVSTIHAQKRFAHNPMAMPPPTPEQREYFTAAWTECIKRDIHKEVNERVKNIVDQRP